MIHRDIKPSNLFLCENGQVKVTDFGVARAVGGTALSTAGVLVGTFAYLPPERWRGDPPAFSNDIWAVGCVLYRLISGRLPRVLPDAADYAAAAVRGDPIPDLRDITDAPAWLTGPVMAMLASDPAGRPAAGDCAPAALRRAVRRRRPPAAGSAGGSSRPSTGPGQPGLSPVTDAAGEDPAAASVTRPSCRANDRRPLVAPAPGRPRHRRRGAAAARRDRSPRGGSARPRSPPSSRRAAP